MPAIATFGIKGSVFRIAAISYEYRVFTADVPLCKGFELIKIIKKAK
jgi:hypothetical protein